MHSASEVYWVGKMYLNENSPIKISYEEFMDKYCSESTEQVSAIISSVTNSYSSYSPLKK